MACQCWIVLLVPLMQLSCWQGVTQAQLSARNRVCSFQLADIDLEMDRKYTECAGGTGDIQVAWDSAGSLGRRSCTRFQVILKCNHTLVI